MSHLSGNSKLLWQLLRDNRPQHQTRLTRVENGVELGMPDVNFCHCGTEGWIELKIGYSRRDPSAAIFGTTRYGLSREQRNWHLEQETAKGKSYILLRIERGLFLFNGTNADSINQWNFSTMRQQCLWYAQMPVNKLTWSAFWNKLRETGYA